MKTQLKTPFILQANEGQTHACLGQAVTVKGSVGDGVLAELVLDPMAGNPLHSHDAWEMFVVQTGTVEIGMVTEDGPVAVKVGPGESILIPGGVPHSLQNSSHQPARLTVVFEHSLLEFFVALGVYGRTLPPGPPSEEAIAGLLAVAARYGNPSTGRHPALGWPLAARGRLLRPRAAAR